jgi:hypothetical protein
MPELGDTSGVSDAKSADSGGSSTDGGPVGGDGPARGPSQTAPEASPEPKLDSGEGQTAPEASPEPKLDSGEAQTAPEASPEPKLDSGTTQSPETSPESKLDASGTKTVDGSDPLAGTKAETVEVTSAEEASESEAITEGEDAYEEYQGELRDGLKDVSDAIEEASNDSLERTQQMTGVADTQFLDSYQSAHDHALQSDPVLNAALTVAAVAAKWHASKRKGGGGD